MMWSQKAKSGETDYASRVSPSTQRDAARLRPLGQTKVLVAARWSLSPFRKIESHIGFNTGVASLDRFRQYTVKSASRAILESERSPVASTRSCYPDRSSDFMTFCAEHILPQCYFVAAVAGGGGGPAVVVTESEPDPAGKGEPVTSVSAPVVPSMLYAETLAEPSFAT
jgi:hypothetical protein